MMSASGQRIMIDTLRARIAERIGEPVRADNVATLVGLISRGNRKLPRETAILNLGAATDCASAKLGMCPIIHLGARCYALKAECMYPSVLPYRRRQSAATLAATAAEIAAAVGEIAERFKVDKLRVSEAGDFRSQSDVDKLSRAAEILAERFKVDTYCYTARHDLDFTAVGALVVNGSGFRPNGNGNAFVATAAPPRGALVCPGDCRRCTLCSRAHGRTVYVRLH